jgi:transposase
MSAIGGLAYRTDKGPTRILLRFHPGPIRTQQVLTFLKHLRRHLSGKVIVIWDGLQAHKAKVVTDWVRSTAKFEVVRLPPYAPDLNAIEGLWAWMKNSRLANVCEDTLGPIIERVRRGLRAARACQRRLRGLLKKTGLSI